MPRPNLRAIKEPELSIPPEFWQRLNDFMLDRRSGNVQLNIREGKLRSFHVEEIVSLKP